LAVRRKQNFEEKRSSEILAGKIDVLMESLEKFFGH